MNSIDVNEVVQLAEKAGREIWRIYQTGFNVEEKADSSPITEADRAADEMIREGLARIDPGTPILTEETFEDISDEERKSWDSYWVVDPLDGTKEFRDRRNIFTVNIALIEEGRPVMGIVHVPYTHYTYFGLEDSGSFKQLLDKEPQWITTREFDPEKPVVVVSRSHPGEGQEEFLAELNNLTVRAYGSALKFCEVAEGFADLYPRFGETNEWDDAAGQVILKAAGGQTLDLEGKPLRYGKPESVKMPPFVAAGDPNWRAR